MQKDFINNMTHEFKTPLSTIRISAGVFVADERIKNDTRLLKYASIILEQNERLNKQVEKVLQLAKMDQGSIDLQIETCSLEDVLTPVIDSMRLRIEAAGGQLVTNIPADIPNIQADRLHLSNVLYNLLDNAAKYCVHAPFIRLSVQVDQQFMYIAVQDNGIGIGKEHHTRVFDRFYRVPTGNIHNVKGFGLGLFYTKRICDAHRWKIKLSSQPNQGTTISIQLPRLQSAKI